MALRRTLLLPSDATNEGSRLLRVILMRRPFTAVAKDLICDEGSVRRWAHEQAKPCSIIRVRAQEHRNIGIRFTAWDEPPSSDVYASSVPETIRAGAAE